MNPVIAIFDDFFSAPEFVREDIAAGEFVDHISEWDGVRYPGINKDIPEYVTKFVEERLGEMLHSNIAIQAIFARLTTKLLPEAPHKIHSDKIMSDFSAHVYLSKDWPTNGGTSFWFHKATGAYTHEDGMDETVAKDMNDVEKWAPVFLASGAFNRILVHDSRLWHCAEPVGGWGTNSIDGRLVLTCFFNAKRRSS